MLLKPLGTFCLRVLQSCKLAAALAQLCDEHSDLDHQRNNRDHSGNRIEGLFANTCKMNKRASERPCVLVLVRARSHACMWGTIHGATRP